VILLRWAARIVAALVVIVVLLLAVTAGRIWWVARHDDRRTSDAIVVLGAAQFDGRPSSIFTARLDHAAELFEADVAPRVITVGGNQAGDRFTEAAAGKAWLADHGVPADRIVAVESGTDTLGSMSAVAEQMRAEGWQTAVIVTDPWHSLRTRSIARSEGIDAVTSPTRQGPAVRTRGTEVRYIARETLAYLYFVVFHRSSDSGPNAL
jgi:uncharacterized SAM-binding protein YcdF (DUF218 family)